MAKKYEPIGRTKEDLALEFKITKEQLDSTKDPKMKRVYREQMKEIAKKYMKSNGKKLKKVV